MADDHNNDESTKLLTSNDRADSTYSQERRRARSDSNASQRRGRSDSNVSSTTQHRRDRSDSNLSQPQERRGRSDSNLSDMVFDALVDAQSQTQNVAHDLVTYEPLDLGELVVNVEEDGLMQQGVQLNETDKEDAQEGVEHFVHPDDPMDPFVTTSDHEPQEKLGVLGLAILVFYNVSGGPFGVEASVRAGGNFYALLGFLVLPLIWSAQEALITAELGTAFPEASGGVAWVEEAFGPKAGWMSGYLGWIAGATDNAIYPVLFLDYLLSALHKDPENVDPILRFLFLSISSIILGYINWRGLPLVGKMSSWICLIAMSPFIIMTVVGIPKVEPKRWFDMPSGSDIDRIIENTDDDISGGILPNASWGGVLWRPLLNNLFWNLNSFDSAGSFSAEVDNPGTNFPLAMLWGVIFVVVGYFVPLLVATGATDFQREAWSDGFLSQVASEIGGTWLGGWTVFAAAISNIALFQAELSADAYQLMGMADRAMIPKIFSKRSRHGTPTNGIILGTGVIVVMGVSNFDQLIEMLNFNYAISLLMEYCAFIKLRISRPDLERPYKIPLGTVGCILLLAPTMLVTILVMVLATFPTFAFAAGANAVGLLVFYGKERAQHEIAPQEEEDDEGAQEELNEMTETVPVDPERKADNSSSTTEPTLLETIVEQYETSNIDKT